MRELVEMQYQFEEPFIVDSSKIATKLGVSATSTIKPSSTPSTPTAPGLARGDHPDHAALVISPAMYNTTGRA
jgi:hypothetical protein